MARKRTVTKQDVKMTTVVKRRRSKYDVSNMAIEEIIQAFCKAMYQGAKKMLEACKYYAAALKYDEDGSRGYQEKFREALPFITVRQWNIYESIGHKDIDERILTLSNTSCDFLLSFGYHQQKLLMDKGFVSYVPGRDAEKGDVVQKALNEMTRNDMEQVFDKDGNIRSFDEQKRWLLQKPITKPKRKTAKTAVAWEFKKKRNKTILIVNVTGEYDMDKILNEYEHFIK